MASFTLSAVDRFPVGTSISVYPAEQAKVGQAPSGSSVASGTMGASSVTFTGLSAGREYMAYALVSGQHRYSGLSNVSDQPPTYAYENRLGAAEAQIESGTLASSEQADGAYPVWSSSVGTLVAAKRTFVTAADPPYRVDSTGVADATIKLQSINDDLAAVGGGTAWFTGTVKGTAQINVSDGVTFHVPTGATMDFSAAATSTTFFLAAGTEATAKSLTADAAAGATTLTCAAGDEAGLVAGSQIRVGSTLQYDPGRTNTPVGEHAVVASTSSGSITLRSPLMGPFTYATADTATFALVTPRKGVRLEGGGKILGGGTGSSHTGVKFDRALHCRVDQIEFFNVEQEAVQVFDGIDVVVDKIHVEHSNKSGLGYGVELSYGCQDCSVINSFFRDVRHGTTTGSGTSRKGFPRRCNFINNHIHDTVADGMDCHGAGEFMVFIANHIYDAGNTGINVNCSSATLKANHVYRPTLSGILLRNFSDGPTEYDCDGNHVYNATTIGIAVQTPANGHAATTRLVRVVNSVIVAPLLQGIQIVSLDTYRLKNVHVFGNHVENPGSYAIQLQKVDNYRFGGNTASLVPATLTAFYLNDVQKGVVEAGNEVEFASLSTGTALLCASMLDSTCQPGLWINAGTGFRLDSSCQNVDVAPQKFSGCTLNYLLQGTGHKFLGHPYPTVQIVSADANMTITPASSPEGTLFTGPITANRAVSLTTTSALPGQRYRITRTAASTGAFNLNVGTGPLKALAVSQWCEVVFDGTAFQLEKFGSL